MKRNKPKFNVDAICTSDWHMMEGNPPCRKDNHRKAQLSKIKQIKKLQKKYNCKIFNAGDIFEHWKATPELINICLDYFPKIISVAGQHDLPQHNYENIKKSAYYSLAKAGVLLHRDKQISWNTFKKPYYFKLKRRRIVIAHMLVWDKEMPFPNCPAPQVNKVFKMFPKADLIITGDNHQTFVSKKGKRILVNPGSLTRHKADQENHRPCIFLYDARTNTVKKHYLKIKKNVISREHIDLIYEKEKRKQEFLSELENGWIPELSFEDNIEKALKENDIRKGIKKHIRKWMGK